MLFIKITAKWKKFISFLSKYGKSGKHKKIEISGILKFVEYCDKVTNF